MQFIPSYGVLDAALFDLDDDLGKTAGQKRRAARRRKRRVKRAQRRRAAGKSLNRRQRDAVRQTRRRRARAANIAARGRKAAIRARRRSARAGSFLRRGGEQARRAQAARRRQRRLRRRGAAAGSFINRGRPASGFNRDALIQSVRGGQQRLLLPPGSAGAGAEGGYMEEGLPGAFDASGMPGFPGVSDLPGAEGAGAPALDAPGSQDPSFADHYLSSREGRGLPPLSQQAGQTAPQVAQYLVNTPDDPDKRDTLAMTAEHILVQAADAAAQKGDAAAADRFNAAAQRWAEEDNADLGFYGYYGEARTLPEGMTSRSVIAIAGGLGAIYAYGKGHRKRRKDDTQTIVESVVFGGAAALGAHVLLRVLGYED